MKDFVTYDIHSDLSENQVFEHAVRALPKFKWRRGDSDAQGPYISGMNDEFIQIKLWLGEDPIEMSVSFDGAWANAPDRENRKQQLLDVITTTFLSSLGTIMKMDA